MVVQWAMVLHYENNTALHIASKLVYHERTKHFKVDCRLIHDKMVAKEMYLECVPGEDQPLDFLRRLSKSSCYYLFYPSWA